LLARVARLAYEAYIHRPRVMYSHIRHLTLYSDASSAAGHGISAGRTKSDERNDERCIARVRLLVHRDNQSSKQRASRLRRRPSDLEGLGCLARLWRSVSRERHVKPHCVCISFRGTWRERIPSVNGSLSRGDSSPCVRRGCKGRIDGKKLWELCVRRGTKDYGERDHSTVSWLEYRGERYASARRSSDVADPTLLSSLVRADLGVICNAIEGRSREKRAGDCASTRGLTTRSWMSELLSDVQCPGHTDLESIRF